MELSSGTCNGRCCFQFSGYVEIGRIPQGARNIRVEEVRESTNYIAVQGAGGEFYLNGQWFIQWTGDYPAAGTTLFYERKTERDVLYAPGPIKEGIVIYVSRPSPAYLSSYMRSACGSLLLASPAPSCSPTLFVAATTSPSNGTVVSAGVPRLQEEEEEEEEAKRRPDEFGTPTGIAAGRHSEISAASSKLSPALIWGFFLCVVIPRFPVTLLCY